VSRCPGSELPWGTGTGAPICPTCHIGPAGLGVPRPARRMVNRRSMGFTGSVPPHDVHAEPPAPAAPGIDWEKRVRDDEAEQERLYREQEQAYQEQARKALAQAQLAEQLAVSTPGVSPELAAFLARITWEYGWRPAPGSYAERFLERQH
jgi:hypothetical protein